MAENIPQDGLVAVVKRDCLTCIGGARPSARIGDTFIVQPLISALTLCTVLDPTRHSRAVLRMPFPLASASGFDH
jgi:hypothetical protein